MGGTQSAPVTDATPFSVVPSAPAIPKALRTSVVGENEDGAFSRAAKLAQAAPQLSMVRPHLLIAGHRAQWPTTGDYALINCAREALFPDDCVPPAHVRPILSLALRDGPSQELLPFLPRVLAAMAEAPCTVVVLCQQGVSRSCSFAIAALMCIEGLSYADAFANVKAARSICSPNPGFLCQLLELETCRIDRTKRPHVYCYGPHGAHDADTWVLTACRVPNTRSAAHPTQVERHPKALFAYCAPEAVYVWCGAAAEVSRVASMEHEIRELYARVWNEACPRIALEYEGRESADFLSLVPTTSEIAFAYGCYDLVAPPPPPSLGVEPETVDTASVVLSVATDLDGPWEVLREYDSSDLVPDAIAWLQLASTAFVWLGADLPAMPNDVVLAKLSAAGAIGLLTIVRQGDEGEAFWDAYESGY
ncbi:hypothetical protein SDRG_08771 [Saprolegnia diclina VS20]|uniref:Tyrosine specific protein phosphatases domain-containing protein n=1 Tax=Saprolegnia diclina (strain VS20) TaxID=1156394 RepID=T0RTM0_SAPDV|nr:hypothetical protein SDRG_08771 [Saprolegnia diclina VS20]EQC33667.1 hypothetical protein SDRG_08771 [Saprolegnia diclina VS20]|eukprot:XP_008612890.1 hypothetical protein SDRG_08771 [Saprolegnia diclina VS20]